MEILDVRKAEVMLFYLSFNSVLLSDETQVGLQLSQHFYYGFCGQLESLADYHEICPLIKRFSNYVSSTNVMAKC